MVFRIIIYKIEKVEKALELYDIVEKFINDNRIWGAECIYTYDRVIENSYEFMHKLCDVVGYKELEDEDD